MKRLSIKNNSLKVHGSILCTEDVTFYPDISSLKFDESIVIDDDIIGDLVIIGHLYITPLTKPNMILKGNLSISTLNILHDNWLNSKLYKTYNIDGTKVIQSKNVYLMTDDLKYGHGMVAYSPIPKPIIRKFKIMNLIKNM